MSEAIWISEATESIVGHTSDEHCPCDPVLEFYHGKQVVLHRSLNDADEYREES